MGRQLGGVEGDTQAIPTGRATLLPCYCYEEQRILPEGRPYVWDSAQQDVASLLSAYQGRRGSVKLI